MGIVTWAVWGLFVGIIARFLLPGKTRLGIVLTILLGATGSIVGGLVAAEVLGIGEVGEFNFPGFLIAVGTSVALLAVCMRISRALPDSERDK
jgi:uncharacterized membrane protein YeaQ/YmgE (transglycosylase-associated protein family)